MATRKCFFCGEEIQAESIKCSFCGEIIERTWKERWKNSWIALYLKRKALEELKKIESLDEKEAETIKSKGWLTLYFKRKRLEEQQKIDALSKMDEQD